MKDAVKEIRIVWTKELFIDSRMRSTCKEGRVEPYQHENNVKIERIHSIIDSIVRPWLYKAGPCGGSFRKYLFMFKAEE
jgi:hypothetical protein